MPFGGVGGYYPTSNPTTYNTGGVTYRPTTTSPTTALGGAQTFTIPPPPPLPTLPTFNSTAIPQIQQLLSQFQNYNAFPALPADVANLINTQMSAYANKMQDKQLASLFGRGVQRSSIAGQESATLSAELAAAQAAMELQARQQAGQQGLAALGAQGGILGTLGGIESGAYGQNLQGMLGLAGLAQQQYATQLGAQQQQQAFAQDLLKMIMSGQFGGGLGGMTGGTGGGFNFGGMTGASGGGYTPQFGQSGYPNGPYGAPTTGTAPTQQQIQQLIWNYIQQVLGG